MDNEIKIGDRVKLKEEALKQLPPWARSILSAPLIVLDVNGTEIGAFRSANMQNGIYLHERFFEKLVA